jgi:hypothetical protein
MFTKAAIFSSDASWKNEAVSYKTGRASWREALRLPRPVYEISWDRPGVEALVEDAKNSFYERTGIRLPHNLHVHGPWVNYPVAGRIVESQEDNQRPSATYNPYRCPQGTKEKMVSTAARLAGWLGQAAESRFLRRVLEKGTSYNGVNSPATVIDLYRLVERYSPGAAERRGRTIQRRAAEILRPYGLSPSYKGIGAALAYGSKAIGKAAVLAAAVTLGHDPQISGGYRTARAFLASVSRTVKSETDTTDGVYVETAGSPQEVEFKLSRRSKVTGTATPFFTRQPETYLRNPGVLFKCGERTFHYLSGAYCRNYRTSLVEDAIWSAERAWENQRNAERTARRAALGDRQRQEALKRVSVLVTFEDSIRAGNCEPGTRAFQEAHGWVDRWYVREEWLVKTGERRAINALASAREKVLSMMG